MQDKNILFLCKHNSARSQIAEGFAKQFAPPEVSVASAGTVATEVNPLVMKVMNELGVDISGQYSKTIADLGKQRFDLVITLCNEARASCPVFPGAPAMIHWPLKDPSTFTGTDAEIKKKVMDIALDIKDMVFTLFKRGFFYAYVQQKENLENILNCLSEGVIAHDLNRKIFFFSRGAERITGFKESEVLGKDCHKIFAPSLCGENCSFCEGCDVTKIDKKQYTTIFLNAYGVRKEFDMSVVPMKNEQSEPIGVVASFTDRTTLKTLERQLEGEQEFWGIIGQDHKMQRIYETIRDLGQCDFPVVITGESGTGKELVARAIHSESPRKNNMFVPINCGALPEGTLESELFGHVRGAFTGAIRDKKGRFELADGGTLFLDEVAELSRAMQVKLLRVLQEGIFEPVGSEKSKQVDVRIISATNKDLKDLVKKETFRDDLYYRLAVVPMEMPPLRERRNDIPILAQSFLSEISNKLGKKEMAFSDDTLSIFMSYSWPGNVRQLQNAIQYTMIKCRGNKILPQHLPPEITDTVVSYGEKGDAEERKGKVGRKPKLTEESVKMSLIKAGGNKAKAARVLGVGRATLYNFINENPHIISSLPIIDK